MAKLRSIRSCRPAIGHGRSVTPKSLPGHAGRNADLPENGFDPKLCIRWCSRRKTRRSWASASAAFRDVASFFRNEAKDDFGNPNPLAGKIKHVISLRGNSQSGNFLRASFISASIRTKRVDRCDGAWPIIAGRRTRSTSAGAAGRCTEPSGRRAAVVVPWPGQGAGLPERGILIVATPPNPSKIIEHSG